MACNRQFNQHSGHLPGVCCSMQPVATYICALLTAVSQGGCSSTYWAAKSFCISGTLPCHYFAIPLSLWFLLLQTQALYAHHDPHEQHVGLIEKKRKEKTLPFAVNLMRSQVLYRAAQVWFGTLTGKTGFRLWAWHRELLRTVRIWPWGKIHYQGMNARTSHYPTNAFDGAADSSSDHWHIITLLTLLHTDNSLFQCSSLPHYHLVNALDIPAGTRSYNWHNITLSMLLHTEASLSVLRLIILLTFLMFLQIQAQAHRMGLSTTRRGCREACPTSPMLTFWRTKSQRMMLQTTLRHAAGCMTRRCISSESELVRLRQSKKLRRVESRSLKSRACFQYVRMDHCNVEQGQNCWVWCLCYVHCSNLDAVFWLFSRSLGGLYLSSMCVKCSCLTILWWVDSELFSGWSVCMYDLVAALYIRQFVPYWQTYTT